VTPVVRSLGSLRELTKGQNGSMADGGSGMGKP
jgi:hypothetical protein